MNTLLLLEFAEGIVVGGRDILILELRFFQLELELSWQKNPSTAIGHEKFLAQTSVSGTYKDERFSEPNRENKGN